MAQDVGRAAQASAERRWKSAGSRSGATRLRVAAKVACPGTRRVYADAGGIRRRHSSGGVVGGRPSHNVSSGHPRRTAAAAAATDSGCRGRHDLSHVGLRGPTPGLQPGPVGAECVHPSRPRCHVRARGRFGRSSRRAVRCLNAEPQRLVSDDVQRLERLSCQRFGLAGLCGGQPRDHQRHRQGTRRRVGCRRRAFRGQLGIRCRGDSPFRPARADRTGGAVAHIGAAVQHRIRVCCVRIRRDVGAAIRHGRIHRLAGTAHPAPWFSHPLHAQRARGGD